MELGVIADLNEINRVGKTDETDNTVLYLDQCFKLPLVMSILLVDIKN